MMQTAQIVPKFVNPAKPGKKYGSVKDMNDGKWIIPAGCDSFFAKGTPANVSYSQQQWGNDTVNIVSAVNGAPVGGGQAQQVGQAVPQQYQAPPQGTSATPPPPPPAPQRNGQDAPPILSNVLAHAIEKGIIQNPKQLEAWAAGTKHAIEAFHRGQVTNDFPGTPNGDPNDDIPDYSNVPEGYAG